MTVCLILPGVATAQIHKFTNGRKVRMLITNAKSNRAIVIICLENYMSIVLFLGKEDCPCSMAVASDAER